MNCRLLCKYYEKKEIKNKKIEFCNKISRELILDDIVSDYDCEYYLRQLKKVEHLEKNKYLIDGEKVELVSAFDSEDCEGCYFLGDSDVFCSKCTAKHICIFKKL